MYLLFTLYVISDASVITVTVCNKLVNYNSYLITLNIGIVILYFCSFYLLVSILYFVTFLVGFPRCIMCLQL